MRGRTPADDDRPGRRNVEGRRERSEGVRLDVRKGDFVGRLGELGAHPPDRRCRARVHGHPDAGEAPRTTRMACDGLGAHPPSERTIPPETTTSTIASSPSVGWYAGVPYRGGGLPSPTRTLVYPLQPPSLGEAWHAPSVAPRMR